MTGGKRKVLFAVTFPILCLVLLVAYRADRQMAGDTVIIPVTGYDPRDILAGHYLTYRLDLDGDQSCPGFCTESPVYLCLREGDGGRINAERIPSPDDRQGCDAVLAGSCSAGSFRAGVERFYVPEGRGAAFDRLVRDRRASVVLSVDSSGRAVVRDMLFDGRSWKEYTGR